LIFLVLFEILSTVWEMKSEEGGEGREEERMESDWKWRRVEERRATGGQRVEEERERREFGGKKFKISNLPSYSFCLALM
jgi:hypothetical protein